MATMVAAGLSLLRTLAIISEQTENKRLAQMFKTVRGDVEAGTSLSDAMGKHSRDFPPLMLNLIRAGEVGGFLESSLESVANNFEAEVKLTGKIKSALSYPIVVLVMAVIAVAAMLIFIVPIFEKMFKQMGASLPLPTQFLVDLSHGDGLHWPDRCRCGHCLRDLVEEEQERAERCARSSTRCG